jgi:hypothetical protein
MFELPVATLCGNELPTIVMEETQDGRYFHAGRVSADCWVWQSSGCMARPAINLRERHPFAEPDGCYFRSRQSSPRRERAVRGTGTVAQNPSRA